MGGDISVSHGRECDHCPIHARWDTGKPILLSFDDVHQRTNDDHEDHDGEHEDGDLGTAGPQGFHDGSGALQILDELQNAKHPHDPEKSDNDQILGIDQHETQIGGENRCQIDQAVETSHVEPWVSDGPDPY